MLCYSKASQTVSPLSGIFTDIQGFNLLMKPFVDAGHCKVPTSGLWTEGISIIAGDYNEVPSGSSLGKHPLELAQLRRTSSTNVGSEAKTV